MRRSPRQRSDAWIFLLLSWSNDRRNDWSRKRGSGASDFARAAPADRTFAAAGHAHVARTHDRDFRFARHPRRHVSRATDGQRSLVDLHALDADVARSGGLQRRVFRPAFADMDVARPENRELDRGDFERLDLEVAGPRNDRFQGVAAKFADLRIARTVDRKAEGCALDGIERQVARSHDRRLELAAADLVDPDVAGTRCRQFELVELQRIYRQVPRAAAGAFERVARHMVYGHVARSRHAQRAQVRHFDGDIDVAVAIPVTADEEPVTLVLHADAFESPVGSTGMDARLSADPHVDVERTGDFEPVEVLDLERAVSLGLIAVMPAVARRGGDCGKDFHRERPGHPTLSSLVY